MRIARLWRYTFSIYAAAALLAGCGGSQLPIDAPGVVRQVSALEATLEVNLPHYAAAIVTTDELLHPLAALSAS